MITVKSSPRFFGGSGVHNRSFLRRLKIAQDIQFTTFGETGRPRTARRPKHPKDTSEAGAVCSVKFRVRAVLRRCSKAQISEPVMVSVKVPVVDVLKREIPSYVQPSETMGEVMFVSNGDHPIAVAIDRAGNLSDHHVSIQLGSPAENSSPGVVVQHFFKFGMGDHKNAPPRKVGEAPAARVAA